MILDLSAGIGGVDNRMGTKDWSKSKWCKGRDRLLKSNWIIILLMGEIISYQYVLGIRSEPVEREVRMEKLI